MAKQGAAKPHRTLISRVKAAKRRGKGEAIVKTATTGKTRGLHHTIDWAVKTGESI